MATDRKIDTSNNTPLFEELVILIIPFLESKLNKKHLKTVQCRLPKSLVIHAHLNNVH